MKNKNIIQKKNKIQKRTVFIKRIELRTLQMHLKKSAYHRKTRTSAEYKAKTRTENKTKVECKTRTKKRELFRKPMIKKQLKWFKSCY